MDQCGESEGSEVMEVAGHCADTGPLTLPPVGALQGSEQREDAFFYYCGKTHII